MEKANGRKRRKRLDSKGRVGKVEANIQSA